MIINLMKRHFQFTQGTLSLEHLYLSRLKSKDYVNTCQWFWFPLAINPARKSILGRLQKNSHYGLHIVITIEMEHKRNLQSWNVWWFRSTVIIFSYKQLFTFFFFECVPLDLSFVLFSKICRWLENPLKSLPRNYSSKRNFILEALPCWILNPMILTWRTIWSYKSI